MAGTQLRTFWGLYFMDRFQLGDVTFEPETRELLTPDGRVELKPKNSEVLHYLILHRDRVIGREELFDELWQGSIVSDHSLTKVITELRQTLGDSARNSTYIRTLHKKGYKWVFEPTSLCKKKPKPMPVLENVNHWEEGSGPEPGNPHVLPDSGPAGTFPEPASSAANDAHHSTETYAPQTHLAKPPFKSSFLFKVALVSILALTLLSPHFLTRDAQNTDPISQESTSAPIALLPFTNHTGDEERHWVESGLRDMVARVLNDIPRVELAPVSDLKKAIGDWDGFMNGSPTPKDLESLHLVVDYSWLISTEVRFEADAYELEFHMFSPSGEEMVHSVTSPTLTGVTELMAYAIAGKTGFKIGNPGSAFSGDNFISETYAKGTQYFEEDDIRKAVNHFQVCLDNDPNQAWARFQMARCQRFLGEWEQSRELFSQVVEQARLDRNPRMEADASRYLGLLAVEQGSWDNAITWTERALELYRNLDHLQGMIVIRNQGAIIYARKGEPEKAVNLLNESLTQLPLLGNRFVEAQTLIKLGTVRSMQGRMREAEEEFNRALAIVKALGDLANEGALLNNLGNIANLRRDYTGAEPHYQNALAIWQELGNKNSEASTLLNLGLIASAHKNHEMAHDQITEALQISRDLGNYYLENLCVNQLGVNAIMVGNTDEASTLLKEGANLARTRQNSGLESDAVCYQALLALRKGNPSRAQELLDQVQELGGEEPLFQTTASLIAYENGAWQMAYDFQVKAKNLSQERWSEIDETVLNTYKKALESNQRHPLPDPKYLPMY